MMVEAPKRHVLTEERLDENSERLQHSSHKRLTITYENKVSKLSAQTGLNFQNETHHNNSRVRNAIMCSH